MTRVKRQEPAKKNIRNTQERWLGISHRSRTVSEPEERRLVASDNPSEGKTRIYYCATKKATRVPLKIHPS